MVKPLPILALLTLLILLAWLNPVITYLAGRVFIILAGLVTGLFFGSFYAKTRQVTRWTIDQHFRYIVRLLLEHTKG